MNPIASISSVQMMLDWLGRRNANDLAEVADSSARRLPTTCERVSGDLRLAALQIRTWLKHRRPSWRCPPRALTSTGPQMAMIVSEACKRIVVPCYVQAGCSDPAACSAKLCTTDSSTTVTEAVRAVQDRGLRYHEHGLAHRRQGFATIAVFQGDQHDVRGSDACSIALRSRAFNRRCVRRFDSQHLLKTVLFAPCFNQPIHLLLRPVKMFSGTTVKRRCRRSRPPTPPCSLTEIRDVCPPQRAYASRVASAQRPSCFTKEVIEGLSAAMSDHRASCSRPSEAASSMRCRRSKEAYLGYGSAAIGFT